jgi:Sigma-70, region 4
MVNDNLWTRKLGHPRSGLMNMPNCWSQPLPAIELRFEPCMIGSRRYYFEFVCGSRGIGHWLKTALGWMVAVTRNCMFNMIDQRDHVPLDDELVQTLEQPAVPDVGIASDISRCLAKLSEKYRECIVLVYHFGLSYEELASRMSVPVNTVKTWIHRSVEQLRLCLNDETR